MATNREPACSRCHENPPHPGHAYCWDCGAELFDQMRAEQSVAEHDAGLQEVAVGCLSDHFAEDEMPF